jgi:hypothetical protein
LVAVFERGLHPDNDGLLTYVEVAETTDKTHAVKLAGALFEAADQQHVVIVLKQFVFGRFRAVLAVRLRHRWSSSAVT